MANENNESLKQFHVKIGGTEIISSILFAKIYIQRRNKIPPTLFFIPCRFLYNNPLNKREFK